MNTYAVINLKTDPELKKKATATAEKLGISLSAVLNNELRRFATEESVTFDVPESYAPTPYLLQVMEEVERDLTTGRNIVMTDSKEDMLAHLDSL